MPCSVCEWPPRRARSVRRALAAAATVTVDCMPKDRTDAPVVLSRIYTKTGDDGTTTLGDFSRTAKTDLRLAAYAEVDEANSAIGVAGTTGGVAGDGTTPLIPVPKEVFDVGAGPFHSIGSQPGYPPLGGAQRLLKRLQPGLDPVDQA